MRHWRYIFILLIMFFFALAEDGNTQVVKPGERLDHPEVPRINAYEAKKLFDQAKLILANAHDRDVFERKHLLGSISLPSGEVKNMNITLPKDQIIAFYCE